MITLQETTEINRPAKEVYDYLVNVENAQKWQPAVIEVKRLTEGPIRVGIKFRGVAKMMGRRISTTCEITELKPNKQIAFKATSDGPMEYQTIYTLEPNGAANSSKDSWVISSEGSLALLEPFLKGEVKKESQQELTTMKKVIETRTL